MLYLLIIFCIVFFKLSSHLLYSDNKRCYFLSKVLFIASIISAIVALAGTVYVCNSDFLTTVEQSSITYQVTDFNVEKSTYNLAGNYETKYTVTVEENFDIKISSTSIGTEIICNSYNPQTVTVEENHYFKWWFMCPYDTYTYTFS